MGRDKEKNHGNDFSDVVRRVGADSFYAKNGFEIYVDPTDDPDIGEIVMVKNGWGPLDEVTNVPKVPPKDAAPLPKVKNEEKEKWWTLGRGRKDSKEKTKDSKENKMSSKRKSSLMDSFYLNVDDCFSAVEHIYEPPRSKSMFHLRLMDIFTHRMT
jgi:hypothetical protein